MERAPDGAHWSEWGAMAAPGADPPQHRPRAWPCRKLRSASLDGFPVGRVVAKNAEGAYDRASDREHDSPSGLVKVEAKSASSKDPVAEKRAVDLIVMGRHGWSGLRRWMFGSVAT
jgi:nucleotide-binding universal stress UspA family protein